jgi:hypothetical protein
VNLAPQPVRVTGPGSFLLTASVTAENTISIQVGGTCQLMPTALDGTPMTPFAVTQVTVPATSNGPVHSNVTLLGAITIADGSSVEVNTTCAFSNDMGGGSLRAATIVALKINSVTPTP